MRIDVIRRARLGRAYPHMDISGHAGLRRGKRSGQLERRPARARTAAFQVDQSDATAALLASKLALDVVAKVPIGVAEDPRYSSSSQISSLFGNEAELMVAVNRYRDIGARSSHSRPRKARP